MARLPGVIDVGQPRGQRYDGPRRPVSDFGGVQDVAEAVDAAGQYFAKRDDDKARKLIQGKAAEYEAGFAERAAGYDGREAGFANSETGHFDAWAKAITEDPELSAGMRLAAQKRLDAYRAEATGRAIQAEARARGQVVAEQKAAQSAQNISLALTEFQALYTEQYQSLADSYDGSTRDFAKQAGDWADVAAEAALKGVPEADQETFRQRIAGIKPGLQAQAMAFEQNKSQAFLVEKVKAARERTTNTVIANPEAYGLSFSTSEELVAGLPASLRGPVLREYRGELAAARVQGLILKGDLATASEELERGEYDAYLDPRQKVQLTEAVKLRSARYAADLIEALRYGEAVDVDEARRAAQASGDPGLVAKVDFAAAVGALEGEALGTLGGGGSRKGFAEAADFVIDELEGGEGNIRNDNGRGLSRFGINQAANPDLDVSKLTRAGAVMRYRRYWQAVGASALPPGLAIAAFDAAVLAGPDQARKWLAESGGDVGDFLARERAYLQDLARKDPAKYGDDLKGWMNRLNKVQAEAARRQAFANVQEGLASDPVKFALGGAGRAPLATVPALPEQPSGAAFRAALQGRAQVAALMNRQYRAPLRMLTNAEAALYKDLIDRDPTAAVDFAREALAAVGPQGARQLMGELGRQGQATVAVHLADLSAAGLDGFADQAARGIAMRGQGQTLEAARAQAIKAELNDRQGVFQGVPDLRIAVQETAEAAMLADQAAGKVRDASFYVNGALGASSRQGRIFGGVVNLNGRQTVIPTWLSADHADDALEIMAQSWAATGRGPVYADGKPVDAGELRRARLQLLANGRYVLMSPRGAAYQAKGGQAFTFDWDDARAGLAGRLGTGAVVR